MSKMFTSKGQNTKKERYGNENYNNINKSKETLLQKYGYENYNNHNKYKETCLEKYGVKNLYDRSKKTQKSLASVMNLVKKFKREKEYLIYKV